jgi:hypothetical protein
MNKERLEWIMSGLSKYSLTRPEDQFVKSALEEFSQNNTMTETHEEKLETLYREKSKLMPNKNLNPVDPGPKKPRPRKSNFKPPY